jgi:hypothetical protein
VDLSSSSMSDRLTDDTLSTGTLPNQGRDCIDAVTMAPKMATEEAEALVVPSVGSVGGCHARRLSLGLMRRGDQ